MENALAVLLQILEIGPFVLESSLLQNFQSGIPPFHRFDPSLGRSSVQDGQETASKVLSEIACGQSKSSFYGSHRTYPSKYVRLDNNQQFPGAAATPTRPTAGHHMGSSRGRHHESWAAGGPGAAVATKLERRKGRSAACVLMLETGWRSQRPMRLVNALRSQRRRVGSVGAFLRRAIKRILGSGG